MKSKLIVLSAAVLVFCASQAFAGGGHDHGKHGEAASQKEKGSMMEEDNLELPNVGNKICPVSGELISEVDDGKGVQVEHNGKIYNLCCSMCAKDFKKNPEKFSKIADEKVEASEHGEGHDDEDHEKKDSHQGEGNEQKGSGRHDHGEHEH